MHPDSRSTHIYINYVDNTRSLDPQGFCCFARVAAGMDVALGLFRCQYNDQDGLGRSGGLEQFGRQFPAADYILRAYTIEPSGPAGALRITTEPPGAEVIMDGLAVDKVTPVVQENVFPGSHHLACRLVDGRVIAGSV